MRSRRNGEKAEQALAALGSAAGTDVNLMPLLVDCARTYCTEGEIVNALRAVSGEYTESSRF